MRAAQELINHGTSLVIDRQAAMSRELGNAAQHRPQRQISGEFTTAAQPDNATLPRGADDGLDSVLDDLNAQALEALPDPGLGSRREAFGDRGTDESDAQIGTRVGDLRGGLDTRQSPSDDRYATTLRDPS